jgi:hypothetical protein
MNPLIVFFLHIKADIAKSIEIRRILLYNAPIEKEAVII